MVAYMSNRRGTEPGIPRHVLIVEDDVVTALVLSEFLSAYGYRISVAKNGPEGVEKFTSERPDLAIVDVLLPRKNGFETCYEMKSFTAHGAETPVLLMSAVYRNTKHATEYARTLWADGFLQKPFDLDTLLERVRVLIGEA
jgi:DNA-binding response OmpR family regulator